MHSGFHYVKYIRLRRVPLCSYGVFLNINSLRDGRNGLGIGVVVVRIAMYIVGSS